MNVWKTKIMRFRKAIGRKRKRRWKWQGENIKETEFKYSGYKLHA